MFSKFFGGGSAKKKEKKQQPPAQNNTPEPAPIDSSTFADPSVAYRQLQQDPQTFLRRNQFSAKGQYHAPSGRMEFSMVSTGPLTERKRRSSVTNEMVDVDAFKVMSKRDYLMSSYALSDNSGSAHRVHHFTAEHLAMEQMKGGQRNDLDRDYKSHVTLDAKGGQNMFTNSLSDCSIVRQGTELTHLQPNKAGGGTFATGFGLENKVKDIDPSADVYGKSSYTGGAHYFLQSGFGGMVDIHSQHVPSMQGDWTATVSHHRFAPLGNAKNALHNQVQNAVLQRQQNQDARNVQFPGPPQQHRNAMSGVFNQMQNAVADRAANRAGREPSADQRQHKQDMGNVFGQLGNAVADRAARRTANRPSPQMQEQQNQHQETFGKSLAAIRKLKK